MKNSTITTLCAATLLWGCGGETPTPNPSDDAPSHAHVHHNAPTDSPGSHAHGPHGHVDQSPFDPARGTHIAIVGNTFSERMASHGHFEAALHAAYPDRELVVRTLGWPADTTTIQPRPMNYGTMEEYLLKERADVILACFGLNEAFDGPDGVPAFKEGLHAFIMSLRDLRPGGGPPQIYLVSPVAHEDLGGDLPDPTNHNANLAIYTQAMEQVAQEMGTGFIDLYHPTRAAIDAGRGPLTINGIHLNDVGDAVAAEAMAQTLWGPEKIDWDAVEPVRHAVTEKNEKFFYRNRPINSFYVMGGRASPFGVVNFPREMEVLDEMIAARDSRIWSIAQGNTDLPPLDDTAHGPFKDIETNYKGEIVFLSPAESIDAMTVPEGWTIECFASEQDFPELANPVSMTFDGEGRLWVLAIPTYPQYLPGVEPDDKLLILEDTNGDGRADTCEVFAEGLHVPTGFELGDGGVYVASQPNLLFLTDTDGDGKADTSETVLHGFGTEDSHHALSAFEWGPGGGLYFQEGTFHHSQIETPHGPTRVVNGAVFRYEPRTEKVRVHVSYGFANPWGHVFDTFGQDIVGDASGGPNYFGATISSKQAYDRKHRGVPTITKHTVRPTGGIEIVSSSHVPPDMDGDLLVTNVIGFQGIKHHDLVDDGAGMRGDFVQNLLQSTDRNFRPTDIQIGPDGAIWFVDWHNPLIGHMQHSLRDPNRDHDHGRVYRMFRTDRPLADHREIVDASVSELLEVLTVHERRVRDQARMQLRTMDTDVVMSAVDVWSESVNDDQLLLEALWIKQNHDVVDEGLLERALRSDDSRVRAGALRVLTAWRDRLSDPSTALLRAANDDDPRVRLEAVVAASWMDDLDGAAVVLEAGNHPGDPHLNHAMKEATVHLTPHWINGLKEGWAYANEHPEAVDRLLGQVSTSDLVMMQPIPAVDRALLLRGDAAPHRRREALDRLSGDDPGGLWVDRLIELDDDRADRGAQLEQIVATLHSAELTPHLSGLKRLAREGKRASIRHGSLAAVMIAEQSAQTAWESSHGDAATILDFLGATALLPEGPARASANAMASRLAIDPAAASGVDEESTAPILGQFIRIELPTGEPLTLSEVEVFSDGRNVAADGTATQSSTGWGGVPERAIDGNTHPSYSSGTQSHTAEGQARAWWELDLGSPTPIDAITIWGRQEGPYGKRLDGHTIRVLSADGGVVVERADQPAPERSVEVVLRENPFPSIRLAAIHALAEGGPVSDDSAISEIVIPLVQEIPVADQDDPLLNSAKGLADRLPELAASLGPWIVPEVTITAVPHMMAYDTDSFLVEAGKPVRVTLTNPDTMAHNLVIGSPGSLETIGRRATMMGTTDYAMGLHFVPRISEVLHWMELVDPGETKTIMFVAPKVPGEYPVICTYPGHWATMNAVMIVAAPDA